MSDGSATTPIDENVTGNESLSPFERKLQEKLAARAAKGMPPLPSQAKAQPELPEFAKDDVPVLEKESYPEDAFKEIINNLDPITALKRLTFKDKQPTIWGPGWDGRNRFRCPWPEHEDPDPDCQFQGPNNGWHCHVCNSGGGDWIELAAAARGLTSPGGKIKDNPEAFKQLLKDLKREFGWVDPQPVLSIVTQEAEPEKVDEAPTQPEPQAQVVELPVSPEMEMHYSDEFPTIDHATVIPGGDDFITAYCKATNEDTISPAFNLACALLLVSAATGHNVQIKEGRNVFGNIAVILTGNTGAGKTRATWHCTKVLRAAFGEDPLAGYKAENVRIVKDPGSDEYLVDQHIENVGASAGITTNHFTPVRSLIQFNELSKLMSQSRRQGSTIMERVFDFLDTEEYIETGSRGRGKMVARNAYASLLSTTQPERLHKVFSDDDASFGAGNRLHFVFGNEVPSDIIEANAKNIDLSAAITKLIELAKWINSTLPDPNNPAPLGDPTILQWSEDAFQELNRWGRDWLTPRRKRDESNLLNRLDLAVKKYTLLFAVNAMSTTIELDHVKRGIAYAEFLYKCYLKVNWRIGITEDVMAADRVMEVIEDLINKGTEVTRRNIHQRVRRKMTPMKLDVILNSLVSLGILDDSGKGGGARGSKPPVYRKTK